MKVRVLVKDPDAMSDAIANAVLAWRESLADMSEEEKDAAQQVRAAKVRAAIVGRWVQWGEYYEIEFDTEAMTARVLAKGEAAREEGSQ